jgi:hypothetical protein
LREGVAAGYGIMDEHFSHIGTREIWGGEQAVGLSLSDRRQHLYMVGKTGSGNASPIIAAASAAGHGVGLIDPHGDSPKNCSVVFHRLALTTRISIRAISTSPSASISLPTSRPTSGTLSPAASSAPRHLARLWGPRLNTFYTTPSPLLDCRTLLLGVNRMLTDADYRRHIVQSARSRARLLDGRIRELRRALPTRSHRADSNKLGQSCSIPSRNTSARCAKVSLPS